MQQNNQKNDVKALAKRVLERNKVRNNHATTSKNAMQQTSVSEQQSVALVSTETKKKKHIFNVWQPVKHLKYLDRDYLSGFIAAKQFTDEERYDFLCEYERRWQVAADQQRVEHRKNNSGRRAANLWLLAGGKQ